MIRLLRPAIPSGHAARAVKGTDKLWNDWRTTGAASKPKASIYAHSSVKKALIVAQHGKCAYCETLNPTSHEVVEHFRPKGGCQQKRESKMTKHAYFWLAYTWDNLLFACDRCNDAAHKGNLFPLANPSRRADPANPDVAQEKPLLINPYDEDPARHIEWNRDIPRARKRSRKGKMSIEIFGLDRDEMLTDYRRQHLINTEKILSLVENSSTANLRRACVTQLLHDCLKESAPWSGMIRAVLGDRILAL